MFPVRGEDAYECVGEVQYAKSQPVTEERVRQQMDKLGNTSFIWEKLEIYMEDSVFVPMKTLNEARHQALEDLKEKLLQKYRRNVGDERVKRIAEETPAKISAIAALLSLRAVGGGMRLRTWPSHGTFRHRLDRHDFVGGNRDTLLGT